METRFDADAGGNLVRHPGTACWHAVRVEVRLFGGIGASSGGFEVDLGGPKQRLVLALLTLDLGHVVSLDRIIDAVWVDDAPERAEVSVRGYVSNLRKVLLRHDADVVLQWRDHGYALTGPIEVDLVRFERLVERGRSDAAGDHLVEAKTALTAALQLWTGPPLGAHSGTPGLDEVVTRWGELRSDAIERLFDARLALGEHREAVADLRAATSEFPFRERLRVQLATALYRSDRPVEALRSIQAARRTLIDEVGVEPGPELRALEARIHSEDPSLDWVELPSGAAATPSPGHVSTAAERSSPIWGRARELSALRAVLDVVRDHRLDRGFGRAIVVGGEPGIGKTAIVEHLATMARFDGFDVAWARCREQASAAPYWPWQAIAADLEANARTATVGAHLTSAIGAALRDNRSDEPSPSQFTTQSAARSALMGLSHPCLVVIDDVQWADVASLSLLEFIAGDLSEVPMAVVVTVRSGAGAHTVGECLTEMSRSTGSVRLELDGLDSPAVAEWVGDVLGPAASGDVAALIHHRSEGNPFFVREIVALLASSADERLVEEAAARELPVAVHDVIRRRTSRLEPETQQLLIVASVIGRDFETDLLAQVTSVAHDRVMELLEPAVDAGLVVIDISRPGSARFSHAIVVDALVAELNTIRRARTHLQVVEAIEQRRAGALDAVLPQLAYHSFAGATAGGASAALGYSLRAAAAASEAHAPQDAATHLERANALLDLVDPNDRARRIAVLTELGLAQCTAADIQVGRTTLLTAATLAEKVGDNDAVVRALAVVNADDLWTSLDWGQHDPATVAIIERTLDALPADDQAARASLLAALAGQTYHSDPPRSATTAAAAVATADLVDDDALVFRVLLQRYWAEWRPSGNSTRTATADRMLQVVARSDLPPGAAALAHLARFTTAYEVGDAPVSDRHLRLAGALVDPARTPAAWSYVLYARVSTELLRGQLDAAEHTIEELHTALRRSRRFVADTTRAGLRLQLRVEQHRTDEALDELDDLASSIYASPIAWFRAWVLAEGGRLDEIDRSLAAFHGDVADDWFKVPLLTAGISAAAASGNVDFIRDHIAELRPYAHMLACTGSGGIVVGPVALALADADRRLGDEASAAAEMQIARDLIERMSATPWKARLPQTT